MMIFPIRKYVLLPFILLACTWHCNQPSHQIDTINSPTINKVDTSGFKNKFIIDTLNCEQFYAGNQIKEILVNEYAIVNKSSVDTLLSTARYTRLWICNFSFNQIPTHINDTVIISGIVYSIGGSEGRSGWPTVLNKIATK